MMDWYDGGHFAWGGWVVMTMMMLAFWGLVVAGGVALYRSFRRGDHRQQDAHADAVRLLDERFARGEIDAADYRERRELLHR